MLFVSFTGYLFATGFFLLLASILGIATVFVSTPQDNEFEIPDREIEVLEARTDRSGFVEVKTETSHEYRHVSDRHESTSSLQSDPLIGPKYNEEEKIMRKMTTNTWDVEVAPQAVQSETAMKSVIEPKIIKEECTVLHKKK